jgi:murein DD-endopeptidase MepM/ murein hydrolase activator NlpD
MSKHDLFPARTSVRRTTASSFSFGVLGLVVLMTVGMTTPAEALPHEHPLVGAANFEGEASAGGSGEIQAYVAPAEMRNAEISRAGDYSVAMLVNLAGTAGISNFSDSVFTNDQTCAVQWPYAVGVPMTYGFGMRDGRMHEGTDFVPGAGAHIQAIAAGVVRTSTDSGGAYGVTIVIDHVVNGQQISSRYAHMEYDSRQVQAGDTVSVGEFVGRTGNTGQSFGAHLHFEIRENGTTAIDPLTWLRSNATC